MLSSKSKLSICFFLVLCSSCKFFDKTQTQSDTMAPGDGINSREVIDIENKVGGVIKVSSDGGASFKALGKVLVPYDPKVLWRPMTDAEKRIPYYNLINGPSNVMVVDATVIHLRIDNRANANDPLGLDIFPRPNGLEGPFDKKTQSRSIMTDLAPGSTLFAGELSPDVGAQLFVGSDKFEALTSENMTKLDPKNNTRLRIVVPQPAVKIESITFENKTDGAVTLKETNGRQTTIAQMKIPISGTGRFAGSAFAKTRGAIVSQGVAHLQIAVSPLLATALALPANGAGFSEAQSQLLFNSISGFEITTLDHFTRDLGGMPRFIFGLVASVSIGQSPLFSGPSLMAEGFRVQFNFQGADVNEWFDIDDAKGDTMLVDPQTMVGVLNSAFRNVKAFRFYR